MVTILMKFDADTGVKNILNRTPMEVALKNNDYDIIYMFGDQFQQFLHAKRMSLPNCMFNILI